MSVWAFRRLCWAASFFEMGSFDKSGGVDKPMRRYVSPRLTPLNEMIVSVLFRNLKIWRTQNLPLSEKDKLTNALY